MDQHFIGVDVGTSSVRAAVVAGDGKLLAISEKSIQVFNSTWKGIQLQEQSSREIWARTCDVVKDAVRKSGVGKEFIAGIGFDATCSLVAVKDGFEPITVNPNTGQSEQNVILWMDHRAAEQAELINIIGAPAKEVLQYVGGSISPEMEVPKLLWLNQNLPETFNKASGFFDLADFMVFRATGKDVRSVCTLGCKWTFLPHKLSWSKTGGSILDSAQGWDLGFLKALGIQQLVDSGRIGTLAAEPGTCVGQLSTLAAEELGLTPSCAVSAGIIDAHAGTVGMVGAVLPGNPSIAERLALICGTSTCHMKPLQDARFIGGIWGPYFGAVVPRQWILEGGQSATGAALEDLISSSGVTFDYLNNFLIKLGGNNGITGLTKNVHVLPFFKGSRSPHADPTLEAVLVGDRLDRDPMERLALQYLATLEALVYDLGTTVDLMREAGENVDAILASGSMTNNYLFVQLLADICEVPVYRSQENAMLMGCAMLGMVAAGRYPDLTSAMRLARVAEPVLPQSSPTIKDFYKKKRTVFDKMLIDFRSYREMMA